MSLRRKKERGHSLRSSRKRKQKGERNLMSKRGGGRKNGAIRNKKKETEKKERGGGTKAVLLETELKGSIVGEREVHQQKKQCRKGSRGWLGQKKKSKTVKKNEGKTKAPGREGGRA